MKLGIVAQRPIFITPYKSIKPRLILAAQGLSGFWQKCIFMYLHASQCQKGVQKVYKRCAEKVKQPRKIQCNKDYNNTPLLYETVQKRGDNFIQISRTAPHNSWRLYCVYRPRGMGVVQ